MVVGRYWWGRRWWSVAEDGGGGWFVRKTVVGRWLVGKTVAENDGRNTFCVRWVFLIYVKDAGNTYCDEKYLL
ncbi:hypothetical protein HanRHA438_Chr04g0168011 [Helianthus annuus]|uniref:Uncharacterized protein n=1 Tax=Helianthus annuus TaxID=4232 RepID=A0A9K3NR33_HELAN|nr:hypothetical protein HanXRQr2_Chr04g0157821 [Helianthus annuus]KAJ0926174.1 hypothetical protein HanRHA438_Chr04g0168011 [Helianthus annuus]KAJ0930669.1 hypothetical protein HanPSC8_Chr04g0152051 [Helianthus annuus]